MFSHGSPPFEPHPGRLQIAAPRPGLPHSLGSIAGIWGLLSVAASTQIFTQAGLEGRFPDGRSQEVNQSRRV